MIVIRRLTDRHRAYTGIFLPGEPAQIFPTTDYEHGRILQIYKQDRPHEGIINDFVDLDAYVPSPIPLKKPQLLRARKKRKNPPQLSRSGFETESLNHPLPAPVARLDVNHLPPGVTPRGRGDYDDGVRATPRLHRDVNHARRRLHINDPGRWHGPISHSLDGSRALRRLNVNDRCRGHIRHGR